MSKFFFMMDHYIMSFFDKVLLLLWNQLSIEKIWVQRMSLGLYMVATIVDCTMSALKSGHWAIILMNSVLILMGCAIFGLLHLKNERIAKMSKRMQNMNAIALRIMMWPFRIMTIAFVVLFIAPIVIDPEPWSSISLTGWAGWYFMMISDAILVSEEPPKRWKFKLPKLSINLPSFSPAPSPTPA